MQVGGGAVVVMVVMVVKGEGVPCPPLPRIWIWNSSAPAIIVPSCVIKLYRMKSRVSWKIPCDRLTLLIFLAQQCPALWVLSCTTMDTQRTLYRRCDSSIPGTAGATPQSKRLTLKREIAKAFSGDGMLAGETIRGR